MRRLAYKIRKARNANYVLMNFEIEAKLINDFKRMLDRDERIIRHLVIKRDKTEYCPPPPEFHILRQNLPTEDDEDEGEYDEEYDEEDEEEFDEEEAEEYDDEEYDEEEEDYDDDDELGIISYNDADYIEDEVIFIDDDDDAKDGKDNMHGESEGARRARRTTKKEKISR